MAITRTPIIDDSGSGQDGTVIDNAWKQELYDQIDAAPGLLSYGPIWKLASTLGDLYPGTGGILAGSYVRIGQLVAVKIGLTLGSGFFAGTAGDAWLFTLPVPPINETALIAISGTATDASPAATYLLDSLLYQNMLNPLGTNPVVAVGADKPMVWAVNDVLRLGAVYFAATSP
jgi:hypothetical protein